MDYLRGMELPMLNQKKFSMEENALPCSYKLGASTIRVELGNNELLNNLSLLGRCSKDDGVIQLATKNDNGKNYPEDTIKDTFYHEKVHSILLFMGKDELSEDEKFVDLFAKLLRQTDVTSEYLTTK